MFKLIVALSLFLAIQAQLPGGFKDRPDLIQSPITRTLVKLAINELSSKQNLRATPINVVSVATQVVNGLNYRITFTARSSSSANILTCTTKVYQGFSGIQSVSSVNCA